MDCSRIDDLLVDYIYQELEPAQVELFEAHIQGCARCTQEVSALETTRTMLQSLPEEDPPAQISALLLQEASRAVQPPTPGFWERLRMSMRSLVMHPAMTAAVTLMLVLGVSFYAYKNNPVEGDAPRVDLPTPLVEADSPTATISTGEGAGATATTEKRGEDKRAAAPAESIARANEDVSNDTVARTGKSGGGRKAASEGQPPAVVSRSLARPDNTVAGTRGRLQARQVMYKDGYKGVAAQAAAPVDNISPNQKAALMPPPAPAPVAVAPSPPATATPPARKAKKRARRTVKSRKGPGVWDDEGIKGESLAKVMKTPPPAAPRADIASAASAKKETRRDRTVQAEQQARRPASSRFYGAKAKPRARPAAKPRPARVAQRPALTVKKPAMPQKQAQDKSKNKQTNALNYLFAGDSAAKNGYCTSALEHFNRALTQDHSLRTRVASAMRKCTQKMNLDQLLKAQKRHQMLANLLESDIKRARAVQYAARKARARTAKKAKAKPAKKRSKGKSSVDAYEAAPTSK